MGSIYLNQKCLHFTSSATIAPTPPSAEMSQEEKDRIAAEQSSNRKKT